MLDQTPLMQNQIKKLELDILGTVGVFAKHLESGQIIAYNHDQPFFMGSTFKVPVALAVIQEIEQEKRQLSDMIQLKDSDQREAAYVISRFYYDMKGVQLSLQNLIQFNLEYSDNAATDILLREIGGPETVQHMLNDIGIESIYVNRSTLEIFIDLYGINAKPKDIRNLDHFHALHEMVSNEEYILARRRFLNDQHNDTTTPEAMACLFERLFNCKLTNTLHRDLLLKFMSQCKTFKNRLPGLLPEGTNVARKTGTIDNAANDVGIITLPDDCGHIVIAVYIKKAKYSGDKLNRVIAEISRSAYDFFMFNSLNNLNENKQRAGATNDTSC